MTTTPFPHKVAESGRVRFLCLCRTGLSLLARCYDRHLQRQDLAELDDRLLRDVGLTRRDAHRECGRPFWQS
jgi:uncharacterized protein YjiS (DUF1127 family)